MTRPARIAWLFDIDGTLLLTSGAAKEAFVRAVGDVLGRADTLDDVAFAGRIDTQILGGILERHAIAPEPALIERFWDSVVEHMRVVLEPGRGRLLDGVPELLAAVAREPRWVPTLLTGNLTRMAWLKLEHFGIAHYFSMGSFGEQARTRDELAQLAVRRIHERHALPPSRCIVIGDTPHDIACARAAGAHAVAVATGPSPRQVLEAHAPDLALDDLTALDRLLEFARDVEQRAIATAD